jgi:LysM repeat protein
VFELEVTMNSLWDILSVAIGISFIFMILSILNSWIQDYIATIFHLRANNLADIIQNLLEPGAEKLNGTKRALADLFPVFLGTAGDSTAEGEPRAGFDNETRFVPYIAETGDTMNKVAKKHKVSAVDLQAANPDALDKTPLLEGMTLSIPYAVKPGGNESLRSIAARFQVETTVLLASNPEVRDKLPQPEGSTVSIQTNMQAMAMDTLNDIAETFNVPTPTLVGANLEALHSLPLPDGLTLNIPYPVKLNTGDTLSSIAEKAEVSAAAFPTPPQLAASTRTTNSRVPHGRSCRAIGRYRPCHRRRSTWRCSFPTAPRWRKWSGGSAILRATFSRSWSCSINTRVRVSSRDIAASRGD